MTTTVAQLMLSARNNADDGPADNFPIDNLSAQVDGTNTRFKLINRNILLAADGAPADPVVLFGNTVQAAGGYSLDKPSGIITFSVAPPAGTLLKVQYYHFIITDAVYLDFSKAAHTWLGTAPSYTLSSANVDIEELAVESAALYIASKAAQKLTSKTNWWYTANAGNKSFNKDQIAIKFRELARLKFEEAEKARADIYTRQGKRGAPAVSHTNTRNVKRWPPRR